MMAGSTVILTMQLAKRVFDALGWDDGADAAG
jgi:hypothetical protein